MQEPPLPSVRNLRKGRRFILTTSIVVLALVALSIPQSLLAARAKLYPVDEAAKDASFFAFRKQLIKAVRGRDLEFVLHVLDPEIKNSLGGDDGIEGFRRIWEPEKPDTALWPTLLKVLSMGGSFYRSDPEYGFIAPYVNSRWPSGFEPYDYAAITGKNVNLRSMPSAKSPVLARLSYDIVKLEGYLPGAAEPAGGEDPDWVKIKTTTGQSGYVSRTLIYSPIDHRVYFVKREGKWIIKTFVAGD